MKISYCLHTCYIRHMTHQLYACVTHLLRVHMCDICALREPIGNIASLRSLTSVIPFLGKSSRGECSNISFEWITCNESRERIILTNHQAGKHQNDVSTSMRRDHVASTLIRRHFNVVCPLGRALIVRSKWYLLSRNEPSVGGNELYIRRKYIIKS